MTATIVPNGAHGNHANWLSRRAEYLQAIEFYRQFAPIYFLENSVYDLLADDGFKLKGISLRKMPTSRDPRRGKGFQEFEMLDQWIDSEPTRPRRWVKLTGRYLYLNIQQVLFEFAQEGKARMIIDQYGRSRMARTGIFCVDSSFYERVIRGMYEECDDATGAWAETVLFRRLARAVPGEVRVFAVEPGLRGISGSTGQELWRGKAHYRLKVAARAANRLFDSRRLWFSS